MADGDVAPDHEFQTGVRVQDRIVLNIRVFTDDQFVRIAAQSAVPPDRNIFRQIDLADNGGIGRDPALWVDLGAEGTEVINGH